MAGCIQSGGTMSHVPQGSLDRGVPALCACACVCVCVSHAAATQRATLTQADVRFVRMVGDATVSETDSRNLTLIFVERGFRIPAARPLHHKWGGRVIRWK
eukprot:7001724-Prymnesium_polylepis.1